MNKGFTLIELMIVIALISIIAGTTAIYAKKSAPAFKLAWTARQVASGIELAKRAAVSSGSSGHFIGEPGYYSVRRHDLSSGASVEIKRMSLPKGTRLVSAVEFRFASSGYPVPGFIGTAVLEDTRGKQKKVVLSSVGRIRIE